MDEIKERVLWDPGKDPARALPGGGEADLVPSHVGDLQLPPGGEFPHLSGKDPQAPFRGAGLLALLEEELVAQADAQEGLPRKDPVPDRVHEAPPPQVPDRGAERSHARQDQGVKSGETAGARDRSDAGADDFQRLGHAAEVAHVVVHESEQALFHSRPFVDGISLDERDLPAACARALAVPLKRASAMWWLFRPLSSLTCRFIRALNANAWKKSSNSSKLNGAFDWGRKGTE